MTKKKTKQRPVLPLVIVSVGLLIVVVVAIALAQNAGQPAGTGGQPAFVTRADVPFPEVARVQLADAHQAYDQRQALFLDVRSAASYAQSRIPGAVSIPLDELANRLSELDANEWIITYCT